MKPGLLKSDAPIVGKEDDALVGMELVGYVLRRSASGLIVGLYGGVKV